MADDLARFWTKVKHDPDTGCLLWTKAKNPDGYGRFRVGRNSNLRAHRWIFQQDHGYLPEVVMHICDTPLCVELRHLIPGTRADNAADRDGKGRQVSVRKLDLADVAQVRRDYRTGMITQRQLAATYGVSQMCIQYNLKGE